MFFDKQPTLVGVSIYQEVSAPDVCGGIYGTTIIVTSLEECALSCEMLLGCKKFMMDETTKECESLYVE